MKLRYVVAFAMPMIVTGVSRAGYLGLGYQAQAKTVLNVDRTVYRIYAVFDNANDYVTAVGGTPANGPATITNLNAAGDGLGTGFYNGSSGSTPPLTTSSVFPPNTQWDTYVTIGTTYDDVNNALDDVTLSPGFPLFTPGQNTTQWGPFNNAMWSTNGPQPQGKAGGLLGVAGPFQNAGQSLDGMGVFIMQLTVNAGQNVEGTVFVSGQLADGSAYTITGQTFSSIPAPGVLGALGLSGLIARRRRVERRK